MGSIVGAAYATGMTVPQMQKAIASITTQSLFNDQPPRQDETMRRKDDDLLPYFVPELPLTRDGLQLPKGVVTGIALEGELRKLVQITNVRSFDDLPIPFRAIATDIGTGEMVVLKEGSVVAAIRASMSVPGAVAPAEVGNRQLVDGGLVRNLPVDIARSMGAEIIIAVNLGTPLLRPDQITSVLSVSLQMINILTEQNVNRSLAEITARDILILPELGDYSAADFDNLVKTVPIGEAAARKVVDRLRALSLPPEQYAAVRARQAAPATVAALTVDAIKVEGTYFISDAIVLQSMQTRVGEPLNRDTIDLDMRRIFGRGDFEDGQLHDAGDRRQANVGRAGEGKAVAQLRAVRPRARSCVGRPGELQCARFAPAEVPRFIWWGMAQRRDTRQRRVVVDRAVSAVVSTAVFFVAPYLRYSINELDLFAGELQFAEYRDQAFVAGVNLGANFIQYGEARLGARVGHRNFNLRSGGVIVLPGDDQPLVTVPPTGGTDIGAFTFSGVLDRLDSINFPRYGYYARGDGL